MPSKPPPRAITISKSLSRLLRHSAVADKVPISADGFVRVSDVLRWPKLRSLGASFDEVVGAVEDNLKEGGKQRFALRVVGGQQQGDGQLVTGKKEGEGERGEKSETERVLEVIAAAAAAEGRDVDPGGILIRATQGHSIQLEEGEKLLTEITLETVPETVVHGTFYGAWERIRASGGLRAMGRNHVHLATGPRLEDVLPDDDGGRDGGGGGTRVEKSLVENRVRSGMRSDAQILIYVDIRRALEAGVTFFRSENGVVLTEGSARDGSGVKVLGMEYVDVVVEIKQGLGVLWRHPQGLVKELPEELKNKPIPHGKQGHHGEGRRGRGGGRGRRGGGGRGRGHGKLEGGQG